jgi:hypothetical protein
MLRSAFWFVWTILCTLYLKYYSLTTKNDPELKVYFVSVVEKHVCTVVRTSVECSNRSVQDWEWEKRFQSQQGWTQNSFLIWFERQLTLIVLVQQTHLIVGERQCNYFKSCCISLVYVVLNKKTASYLYHIMARSYVLLLQLVLPWKHLWWVPIL